MGQSHLTLGSFNKESRILLDSAAWGDREDAKPDWMSADVKGGEKFPKNSSLDQSKHRCPPSTEMETPPSL
jgi:hypothetical protein